MKLSNRSVSNLALGLCLAGVVTLAPAAPAAAITQCEQLGEQENIFAHAHDVRLEYTRAGKAMTRRVKGVVVRLRAEEGHSSPYLQRLAICQLGAVLGTQADDVSVRIEESSTHFELHIRTDSARTARAVVAKLESVTQNVALAKASRGHRG